MCTHPQEEEVNSDDVTVFTMKRLLSECEHVPVKGQCRSFFFFLDGLNNEGARH